MQKTETALKGPVAGAARGWPFYSYFEKIIRFAIIQPGKGEVWMFSNQFAVFFLSKSYQGPMLCKIHFTNVL